MLLTSIRRRALICVAAAWLGKAIYLSSVCKAISLSSALCGPKKSPKVVGLGQKPPTDSNGWAVPPLCIRNASYLQLVLDALCSVGTANKSEVEEGKRLKSKLKPKPRLSIGHRTTSEVTQPRGRGQSTHAPKSTEEVPDSEAHDLDQGAHHEPDCEVETEKEQQEGDTEERSVRIEPQSSNEPKPGQTTVDSAQQTPKEGDISRTNTPHLGRKRARFSGGLNSQENKWQKQSTDPVAISLRRCSTPCLSPTHLVFCSATRRISATLRRVLLRTWSTRFWYRLTNLQLKRTKSEKTFSGNLIRCKRRSWRR